MDRGGEIDGLSEGGFGDAVGAEVAGKKIDAVGGLHFVTAEEGGGKAPDTDHTRTWGELNFRVSGRANWAVLSHGCDVAEREREGRMGTYDVDGEKSGQQPR